MLYTPICRNGQISGAYYKIIVMYEKGKDQFFINFYEIIFTKNRIQNCEVPFDCKVTTMSMSSTSLIANNVYMNNAYCN